MTTDRVVIHPRAGKDPHPPKKKKKIQKQKRAPQNKGP